MLNYKCVLLRNVWSSDKQFLKFLFNNGATRLSQVEDGVSDISDGTMYRHASVPSSDRAVHLTMAKNIDGKPCFQKSKLSLWPVYLRINDILCQQPVRIVYCWYGTTVSTKLLEHCVAVILRHTMWCAYSKPSMMSFFNQF